MSAVYAESVDDRYEFHIDGGALGPVMEKIHQKTGIQLLFSYDLVEFEGVNAVNGQYTVQEAMAILLHDTGLTSGLTESGMIVITRENSANAQNREEEMASGKLKKGLLASVAAFIAGTGAQAQDVESNDENNEQERDVIVVTGTNIRGVSPDSSPSFVFDREDINKTGFGTTAEFIQSLPQNFSGGSNAAIGSLPNDRAAGNNISSGSSVNLRGLGSGATLVLLNGSRLTPAGSIGDFVDISMIPLSAVERVEVLTDGASAIYGADAIGGVVNFVLRDDYDGAESFVRVGSVTEGDLSEYRAGQTIGKSWDSGNALVSYEFYHRDNLGAEDRDFSSSVFLPQDLLPEQESHSVLVNASQQLSERVTLRGHATFSQRDGLQATTLACCGGAFSFSRDSTTKQYGGLVGADINLWGDWQLAVSGAYNKLDAFSEIEVLFPTQIDTDSDLWSVDGKLDGTLVRLPGGEAKLAVGVGYREETFSNANLLTSETIADDNRNAFGVFAEAFIPLVGTNNRRAGIERLELTVAGRYDDYSDFGDTLNPKVGLLWSPADGLNFRGTYSTSFNPPNLGDSGNLTNRVNAQIFSNPASPTGTSVVITDASANRDLTPETSTTWTAGIDFNQDVGLGDLGLSLTWFSIEFEDRIDRAGRVDAFLLDPISFAPVIIANPDPAFIADVIANATSFRDRTSGVWTMPGDEEFYLDGRLRNLAGTNTSGLDSNLDYSVDSGDFGQFDFGLNSSYLFKQEKNITTTSPVFDVIDTIYNPVGFRLRGSAGWSLDGVSANLFINYVDSYTDDRNILGMGDVPIPSWTTVDVNLSYDTGDRAGRNLIDNTRFSLSVLNLFNEDPPAITPDSFASGFDTTNASPLGRFIAFQVSKSW